MSSWAKPQPSCYFLSRCRRVVSIYSLNIYAHRAQEVCLWSLFVWYTSLLPFLKKIKWMVAFRAKAYGDTADECAEAFFWCGRALLDLARYVLLSFRLLRIFFFLTELFKQRQSSTSVLWCRMENSVLGNALEGVPEGDEDEKPQESNVEGTENVDGAWIMLKVKRSTLKVVGWFGFWGEDQWQDFRISLKCTPTFTGQLKLGTPFIQLQLENSKFVYTKYRNHK